MGKEKWEEACDFAFDDFKRIQPNWKNYNHTQKIIKAGVFYQYVFANGMNFSGLVSREVIRGVKSCIDHWMPARLVIRAAMENYPELFHNKDEFRYIFREVCQSTVKITSHQNEIVKFKNSKHVGLTIKHISTQKYEICKDKDGNKGIKFYNNGKGSCKERPYKYAKEFPLKYLVPEWITNFELKHKIEITELYNDEDDKK
jgi:hypothetical protein